MSLDSLPFLSILIPVYNWDVGPLLGCLAAQRQVLPAEQLVEIIVLDDGSAQKYHNQSVAARLASVSYVESSVNQGRAAVRNALLQRARGSYVLFLDADMLPDDEKFLSRYLEKARQGSEIVCGGISYRQNVQQRPEFAFYLYKSQRTEALSATVRQGAPWRYLFTSNILVRRDILGSVCFDPRFTGYGFEDVEWGVRLEKSYAITHIDNTCSHMGLLTKEQVSGKMRDSIRNYALLVSLHPQTGRSGAARIASLLRVLPDSLLAVVESVSSFLFLRMSSNKLLFWIFQGQKAVLLARELKKGDV